MLLLHTAHHYAKVPRLNDHTYALGLDGALDGFRDLYRKPLLHLQTTGKNIDETRDLAQPDDLAVGNIRDMHLAEERQHVVLTKTEHFNVFDDHHLVIVHLKQRAAEHLVRVLVMSFGQVL